MIYTSRSESNHDSMTHKSITFWDMNTKDDIPISRCRFFILTETGTMRYFTRTTFSHRPSSKRGYHDSRIESYQSKYNVLSNLELLTDSENLSKNATPFDDWIRTRDAAFRKRHLIRPSRLHS